MGQLSVCRTSSEVTGASASHVRRAEQGLCFVDGHGELSKTEREDPRPRHEGGQRGSAGAGAAARATRHTNGSLMTNWATAARLCWLVTY